MTTPFTPRDSGPSACLLPLLRLSPLRQRLPEIDCGSQPPGSAGRSHRSASAQPRLQRIFSGYGAGLASQQHPDAGQSGGDPARPHPGLFYLRRDGAQFRRSGPSRWTYPGPFDADRGLSSEGRWIWMEHSIGWRPNRMLALAPGLFGAAYFRRARFAGGAFQSSTGSAMDAVGLRINLSGSISAKAMLACGCPCR